MARRYDSRTTTFSPEGRLYQVEYALEAINNASSTLGVVAKDGVVLAADKMVTSKLLDQGRAKEKIYKVDDHVMCAVAGLTADANILIAQARLIGQRYLYAYGEQQPIEQLVLQICDIKQIYADIHLPPPPFGNVWSFPPCRSDIDLSNNLVSACHESYTQFGGLRPFGVSFLFAGWDRHYGFQLYHTDPSGNYSGWKATAIGINNQSAQSILKQDWNEDLDVEGALLLAAKVLNKTMDTAMPSAEKLEIAIIKKDPENESQLLQVVLSYEEITQLMKKAQEIQAQEQTPSS